MKKTFALCWLLLVGCAQNTPSQSPPIQPNTNWSSGILDNGMKYYLYPMDSNKVSMQLLIKVGSGAEEPNQLGYAHYVEHLAFEGSENFTTAEIERLIDATGAEKMHGVNAYTSYGQTVYKLNLPNKKKFDTALLWLRDVASRVTFSTEEVDKEKSILLSENRYRSPEHQSFSDKYYDFLIKGSVQAQRSPGGTTEMIQAATSDSLKTFYNKWYQPQNAELIIAGNIERSETKAAVEKLFSDWIATNSEQAPKLPPLKAKKDDFIARVADGESALLGLRFDRGSNLVTNQEQNLNSALNAIVAELISIRLGAVYDQQALPLQTIYSDTSRLENLKVYEVGIAFSGHDRNLVQPLFLTTLASLRDHGVSQSELDSVLASYQNHLDRADEYWQTYSPENFVFEKNRERITGEPTQSRQDYKLNLEHVIQSADINTVNQYLYNMLSSSYGMFVGAGAEESVEHIEQALPEWKSMYRMTGVVNNQINFDINGLAEVISSSPLPNSVEFENGEDLWTLDNGVEVLLDPDVKSDFVNLVYMSAGGLTVLDRDLLPAAAILLPVIARSGVGNFDGPQMKAFTRKNSIDIQGFINGTEHGFSIHVPRKNLDKALQYLYTSIAYPKFDPKQVDAIKRESADQALSYLKSPLGQWYDAIATNTYAPSSAYFPIYAQDFNKVTVDQVQQAFEQLFRQSRNNKLVIIADMKPTDITESINNYVATLPLHTVDTPAYQIDYNSRPDTRINLAINNERKGGFVLRIHNKQARPQNPRLDIVDQIIEHILADRLHNYVREEMSLDYSPASYSNMSFNQTVTDWAIESQVAVEDLPKVEKAIDKVVRDLRESITREELKVAKKQLYTKVEDIIGSADSTAWLRALYMVNDLGKDTLVGTKGVISDISIEEVKVRINESFGQDTESYRYILSPLD
ncbi:M16 family metallopeptidase [Vibrio tetraodonis]|uniref:M16 family metallopeptidase n=1 Tax=Vibrio tetraodonis TaxID=2231647 RepID=UPI000E0B8A62|nr:M16 family metallopeptidase [Vibrio tetraodonis]